MNKLFLLFFLLLGITSYAQENGEKQHLTLEKQIFVSASSLSIQEWLEKIEEIAGITISYNSSSINLKKKCTISENSNISLKNILKKILSEYTYQVSIIPSDKLALHVTPKNCCHLHGNIIEEGSLEKLYGAFLAFNRENEETFYAISDINGHFSLLLTEGKYLLTVSHLGHNTQTQTIHIQKDSLLTISMQPHLFEMEEVTINPQNSKEQYMELSPTNILSFNSNDLFSQIWILPGVTGSPASFQFQVDGGNDDENLLLLDGIPIYYPGHLNSLLPSINGDAIKDITFYKGFFPTRLEGRVSSVTEINLKEGHKQEHKQTLSLDMPAAAATFEGPLIKNKFSYIVSGRRSWLDFFDNLFNEEERMNHSSYDYIGKLSLQLSKQSNLQTMIYQSKDNYHQDDGYGEKTKILQWNNQMFQLSANSQHRKLHNRTSLAYTSHRNSAHAYLFGFEDKEYIHSGIKTISLYSDFTLKPENIYTTYWGIKYSHEIFDIANIDEGSVSQQAHINQFSLYHDNLIYILPELTIQVGIHFVGYFPKNSTAYYSIQPRFSMKFAASEQNLFSLQFSKMEQFYHNLRLGYISLPTDFRMPSINGYKPRTSEHYEFGWKHLLPNGQMEITGYYKTRKNIIALRPDNFINDTEWKQYIMTGKGESYGSKFYFFNRWHAWTLQLSYAYIRSKEQFDELKTGKIPSLYDIPHQAGAAISYQATPHSTFSIGGISQSGKIIEYDQDDMPLSTDDFRKKRAPMNYRMDAGYAYKKDFGQGKLLLIRAGLYNIIGNPLEEDILSFYSVHWYRNCLPYISISFKL